MIDSRARRRPRRLPKPLGVLIVIVFLMSILGGAVLGGRAVLAGLTGSSDFAGTGTGRAVVQIHPGDTAAAIGGALLGKGVVKSVGAFRDAASADPRSRSLQPGFYALRQRMSGSSALALLLDPKARLRGRVTIPEGSQLRTVLDRLARDTSVPRAYLAAALSHPAALGLPAYASGKPEGFLFPATYDIEPGTTAVQVLSMMTERFGVEAAALDLDAGAQQLGRSTYDIVTVASLVEAETSVDADRAKVARVVYNRLAKGIKLQFDSTVNYSRPVKKARLSNADTTVASPYNTYLIKGLPPGPINSPGRKALEAALHPAQGDYLYFVTIDKQGHSLFTDSFPAFQAAVAKAQRDGVY